MKSQAEFQELEERFFRSKVKTNEQTQNELKVIVKSSVKYQLISIFLTSIFRYFIFQYVILYSSGFLLNKDVVLVGII